MARRNINTDDNILRGESGRMDPSMAERMSDWQSPFTGMFNDESSAPSSPGGGGLPWFGGGPEASVNPALQGTQASVNPALAGAGKMSGIGSWLGKNGLDLGLGIMSLFGGDDDPFQKRTSFRGQGLADPSKSLNTILDAIQKMAQNMSTRVQPLTSSVVQQGPAPVSIPGIPFQIGGGLGMDPALKNMGLLEPPQMQNPFAPQSQPGARRRQPQGDR